jgi:anti-anti-sigma factor
MELLFEAVPIVGQPPPELVLRGEFDADGEPAFERALRAVLADGPPALVVDIRDLRFLGSTGLRGFVRARNAVGDVTVRGAGPWMRRVFEAASLDSLFRFEA